MPASPDIPTGLSHAPFLGSEARKRGLLTTEQLRGKQWVRLWHDVYTHVDTDPDSLATRLRGLMLIVPEGAVVGGSAAAGLHGADYRRKGDPITVVVPRDIPVGPRQHVEMTHAELLPDDTAYVRGIPVTAPLRTAFDLARLAKSGGGGNLREHVAAVNAMLHVGVDPYDHRPRLFTVDGFRCYVGQERLYRWVGVRQAAAVAEFAEPLVESPEESRLMMDLVGAGLPKPVAQYRLATPGGRRANAYLDLAYPELGIGIEYDGECHADRREADVERWHRIEEQGFRLFVLTRSTRRELLPKVVRAIRTRLSARGVYVPEAYPRQAHLFQWRTAMALREERERLGVGENAPCPQRRLPFHR
ncbi:hypothetical protein HNR23_003484 [Nocardiopsis mwathae]|uniref:AbiEi antitoxin C-terminal domain-containing protein n=1 Tax=Nocardiopsis mwathae TaxID=1472723 RepID=A0A7W9YJP8_9ACTN|nr:type IV toxin-antitoxin system AbiEi family antitoxin [Nocardiopsis mwathae]MBB6173424.1 hypothetical protein [Nocardiopsis mwathae]